MGSDRSIGLPERRRRCNPVGIFPMPLPWSPSGFTSMRPFATWSRRSVQDRTFPASYHSYQLFTLTIVNPQLDTLAYQGAKFLEARGYRAYPFPANMPHELGLPPSTLAARATSPTGTWRWPAGWDRSAGTGCSSRRSSVHGQKLTTIATNAPLVPDAIFQGELCDPARCGFRCARACPTAAIPAALDEKVSISIGDRRTEYAKIVGWKCRWGCSGMLTCTGGYKDIPMPDAEPTPDELLRYKSQVDPWQERVRRLSGLLPYCGRCLCVCRKPTRGRACPAA